MAESTIVKIDGKFAIIRTAINYLGKSGPAKISSSSDISNLAEFFPERPIRWRNIMFYTYDPVMCSDANTGEEYLFKCRVCDIEPDAHLDSSAVWDAAGKIWVYLEPISHKQHQSYTR